MDSTFWSPARTISRNIALAAAAVAPLLLLAPRVAAATPEPGTVVTLADVEKELGGKWTSRSPEPGVLFYEEDGGSRQVNVYLWPAGGKTVESMKVELAGHGEPIDDVTGVGDAAMYRPQGNVAETEQKDPAGEVQWLTIAVHNVENAADTKRFAIALAKKGAERLKKP